MGNYSYLLLLDKAQFSAEAVNNGLIVARGNKYFHGPFLWFCMIKSSDIMRMTVGEHECVYAIIPMRTAIENMRSACSRIASFFCGEGNIEDHINIMIAGLEYMNKEYVCLDFSEIAGMGEPEQFCDEIKTIVDSIHNSGGQPSDALQYFNFMSTTPRKSLSWVEMTSEVVSGLIFGWANTPGALAAKERLNDPVPIPPPLSDTEQGGNLITNSEVLFNNFWELYGEGECCIGYPHHWSFPAPDFDGDERSVYYNEKEYEQILR
jgi:hypothetical protein